MNVIDDLIRSTNMEYRLKKFMYELYFDINRPEGRYGIHGRDAVGDDYFLALEYVVKRIEDILQCREYDKTT